MGRRAVVATLALAAAAVLVGPAGAANTAVTIKNVSFQPSSVTINPGDTVTWTHMDGSTPHSVTSNSGAFDSNPNCTSSGVGCMTNGNTFSHTFPQAGSFPYHCRVHSNMTGTITVIAPGPPPTQPPATQPAPAPQPAPTPAPVARTPATTAAPTATATTAPTTTVVPAAEQSTTSSTSSAAAGGQALATEKTSSGGGGSGALKAVAAVLLAVVAGGGLFYRRRLI